LPLRNYFMLLYHDDQLKVIQYEFYLKVNKSVMIAFTIYSKIFGEFISLPFGCKLPMSSIATVKFFAKIIFLTLEWNHLFDFKHIPCCFFAAASLMSNNATGREIKAK